MLIIIFSPRDHEIFSWWVGRVAIFNFHHETKRFSCGGCGRVAIFNFHHETKRFSRGGGGGRGQSLFHIKYIGYKQILSIHFQTYIGNILVFCHNIPTTRKSLGLLVEHYDHSLKDQKAKSLFNKC